MFLNLFSGKLKGKKQIPIIYRLGWWAHQEMLEITSFDVEIVQSNLNLLNSISLIRYTVKGYLYDGTSVQPHIQAVHHSEQLLKTGDAFSEEADLPVSVHAHIQITPIVHVKHKKNVLAANIPFEFTNEYALKSLRWGDNCFQFSCGRINKTIHLSQRK